MTGRRWGTKGGLAIFGVVCALLVAPSSAGAANFVVNSLDDGTPNGCTTAANGCTLREALTDAHNNGSNITDQISFSVTGTIPLTSGLPTIDTPTSITGPGPDQLAVAGNSVNTTLFVVNIGVVFVVEIEGIKIESSRAVDFAGGGISKSGAGRLELDSVWLFDNNGASGGALNVDRGRTVIKNSTLSKNRATGSGGAIRATQVDPFPAATVDLINSTVSGDSAKEFGGGVNVARGATITIRSSTIAGNTANSDGPMGSTTGDGGGIYNNASTVNLANTILAGNLVGTGGGTNTQCGPLMNPFTSQGHNLRSVDDPGCKGFTGTGDFVDANPMLGTLGQNGGPTPTIPLLDGSPAIDAGDPSPVGSADPACPATDQRGLPRGGLSGVCDIGAFEVQPPPPSPPQPPSPPPTGDATAPDTAITKGPKDKTRKRTATFEFTSSEPGSTFACSLDGGPFEPCSSPKTYEKLKRKRHHFEVVATDVAGNADATSATDDWKVRKKHRR